ncbi:MAG: DUF3445 domain-containing protein [Pseudomonadota bacterium]
MSETILQRSIPYPALDPRALPSLQVMEEADWLVFDDAETQQLALRKRLLRERAAAVLARLPGAEAAEAEACAMIVDNLARFHGRAGQATRLEHLAGLIQEDVVILEPRDAGHVMIAALLCFPASWLLSEKIGRPMAAIHAPVDVIGPRMDRQIERVFRGLRPDRPLWRYNQLWYHTPELFQPRSAGDRREKPAGQGDYLRSERQCLVKMPHTGCVMFTIHTYVVARADIEAAFPVPRSAAGSS